MQQFNATTLLYLDVLYMYLDVFRYFVYRCTKSIEEAQKRLGYSNG